MLVKLKGNIVSLIMTKDGNPVLGMLVPGQDGNQDHVRVWGLKGKTHKLNTTEEISVNLRAKEIFCSEVA